MWVWAEGLLASVMALFALAIIVPNVMPNGSWTIWVVAYVALACGLVVAIVIGRRKWLP